MKKIYILILFVLLISFSSVSSLKLQVFFTIIEDIDSVFPSNFSGTFGTVKETFNYNVFRDFDKAVILKKFIFDIESFEEGDNLSEFSKLVNENNSKNIAVLNEKIKDLLGYEGNLNWMELEKLKTISEKKKKE